MSGFIKYNRSELAKNLHCRPNENHLLSIIAYRTSRNGNPVKGVEKGEALIGDYENIGLKRQPYRTALTNLIKWGYITTRVTNRTTYAKLVNIEVYDCNIFEPNHQSNPNLTTKATTEQPPKQPTSNHNQECKNKESNKYISEFLEIANHYKAVTKQDIKIGKTESKIMRSDKYKKIVSRLKDGYSVDDCKQVISFKTKQWEKDNYMSKNICIPTFFRASNFEKYLDESQNLKADTPNNNEGFVFKFNEPVYSGKAN